MENATPAPQRLKDLMLSNGGYVFDAKTGRSYTLNSTAQVALLLLMDDYAIPDVAKILARRSGQHEAVVEAGLGSFVDQLRRYVR